MVTKSIAEWERLRNCIVRDASPSTKMTEKEFDDIPLSDKHSVNHVQRIEFLRSHGYEVNRENMVKYLPARP